MYLKIQLLVQYTILVNANNPTIIFIFKALIL